MSPWYVEYQPLFDIALGHYTGMEALLRWDNHEIGEVQPEEFIPLAEDTELIISIGEWSLRESCRQATSWASQGMPLARMAVNVSATLGRRQGLKLAVLFMGLDGFKRLNDNLGHSLGDQVLQTAGECLQMGFRGSDMLTRTGNSQADSSLARLGAMSLRYCCPRSHAARMTMYCSCSRKKLAVGQVGQAVIIRQALKSTLTFQQPPGHLLAGPELVEKPTNHHGDIGRLGYEVGCPAS